MSPLCCAFAYASELSESAFSATAAFTGAATFALISDIAARSGSSSPASSFSSSRVSFRYSSVISAPSLEVALVDRRLLRRIRVRDRAVREDVRGDGRVHRDREVRVHERHRRALRQLLARQLLELLGRQLPILLRHAFLLVRL